MRSLAALGAALLLGPIVPVGVEKFTTEERTLVNAAQTAAVVTAPEDVLICDLKPDIGELSRNIERRGRECFQLVRSKDKVYVVTLSHERAGCPVCWASSEVKAGNALEERWRLPVVSNVYDKPVPKGADHFFGESDERVGALAMSFGRAVVDYGLPFMLQGFVGGSHGAEGPVSGHAGSDQSQKEDRHIDRADGRLSARPSRGVFGRLCRPNSLPGALLGLAIALSAGGAVGGFHFLRFGEGTLSLLKASAAFLAGPSLLFLAFKLLAVCDPSGGWP